jgi:hypothetical protein
MQKIYYDRIKNFTIIDVSGIKPPELIRQEFYPDMTLDDFNKFETLKIDEKKEYFITTEKIQKVTRPMI